MRMRSLYIIYGFNFLMLSNIDHTRGGINRTYLRLKFKGMQINQLLLLVVVFVLSFELMLGSWLNGIEEFFLQLCYSPLAVVFCFCFCKLKNEVFVCNKNSPNTLPFFESYLHWIIPCNNNSNNHKRCGWKAEKRQRDLCSEREREQEPKREKNNSTSLQ